jgi:hypothetical protein
MVMNVPDLAVSVFDFCDDNALWKCSMVSRYLRNMLTSSEGTVQTRKKYFVRILEYKYTVTASKLENIQRKIDSGVLIDKQALLAGAAMRGLADSEGGEERQDEVRWQEKAKTEFALLETKVQKKIVQQQKRQLPDPSQFYPRTDPEPVAQQQEAVVDGPATVRGSARWELEELAHEAPPE